MGRSQEHTTSVWVLIVFGCLGFIAAFTATVWGAMDATAYAWTSIVATAMMFGGLGIETTAPRRFRG